MSEPGYLLVKVDGDWLNHTVRRLPELGGIESVRVLAHPGEGQAVNETTSTTPLADALADALTEVDEAQTGGTGSASHAWATLRTLANAVRVHLVAHPETGEPAGWQVTRADFEEMAGHPVTGAEMADIAKTLGYSDVMDTVRDAVAQVCGLADDEDDEDDGDTLIAGVLYGPDGYEAEPAGDDDTLGAVEVVRLTELSAVVPGTCQDGTAHESGSAYCEDHDGDVPEMLTEVLSTAGNFDDYRDCDRAAAYLYAASAEVRAAVDAFYPLVGGPGRDDGYDAVQAAVLAAARKALAS
jgi:hypothetical protein